MIEVKKSIETGQPLGLYGILQQLQGNSYGFMQYNNVYHVESNTGSDSSDGKSWDTAFKTLTFALAISDADISASDQGYGRGWASRNAIFCKGSFTEDLVLLADKTDVIGVGIGATRCKIIGTHIPADNTYGTRMINFELRDDGTSAMWTFGAGGFEFHNCWFRGWVGLTGTHALYITDPSDVRIQGCQFSAWPGTSFTTAAIEMDTTLGAANVRNCFIVDNYIHGAIGIIMGEGALSDCVIQNNIIEATTLTIDDNSADSGTNGFRIIGNRLITSAAKATLGNVIDYNAVRAVDNILTGSDGTIHCPAETA